MSEAEICYLPATELARDIAERRLSPVEVVETFLGRIERLNPVVNAYCTLTADQARAAAREAEAAVQRGDPLGPLHGVPVSIKDVVVTRGIRTTRGSRLYEDFVPDEDSPIAGRLRAAGAILLGKTNTPEFGWKGVTDNQVFGPTRNPWDLERTPGGSSGGASAQVAAGLGPLAIGTDGAGSIRIPSSFGGCFGLKPSFGRVSIYPPSALEPISHAGPMTWHVRDAALMMNVIAGPDERDRNSLPADGVDYLAACAPAAEPGRSLEGWRVAWSPDLGYAPVEPEVRRVAEAAARRFAELGCEVEEVRLDWPCPEETEHMFFYGRLAGQLGPRLEEIGHLLDPGMAKLIEEWRGRSMIETVQAEFDRVAFWNAVRPTFERYDLLLTPTMALTAFEVGKDAPEQVCGRPDYGLGWCYFTYPFNLTGQPAASLPCGFTSAGLPVGLQIVGRRYADAAVLGAAAAFEAIAPWQGRVPAL